MEKINLYVDMDGTLCEWRNIENYEELYEKGYFASLEPHENVVQAIKYAIAHPDIEVYILSSVLENSKFALGEKNEWLNRHFKGKIPAAHRIFSYTYKDKHFAINRPLTSNDILFDDYSNNLVGWANAGGTAIKLLNDVNGKNVIWKGRRCSKNADPNIILNMILSVFKETEKKNDKRRIYTANNK